MPRPARQWVALPRNQPNDDCRPAGGLPGEPGRQALRLSGAAAGAFPRRHDRDRMDVAPSGGGGVGRADRYQHASACALASAHAPARAARRRPFAAVTALGRPQRTLDPAADQSPATTRRRAARGLGRLAQAAPRQPRQRLAPVAGGAALRPGRTRPRGAGAGAGRRRRRPRRPCCSRRIAEAWGCTSAIHPDAGHDLPLDDPQWTIERIVGWHRTLPAARTS